MTVLVLALVASLALAITFAAKWQEARQDIRDERSVWLTEVKALEHDKGILIEGSKKDAEAMLWYADHLSQARRDFRAMQDNNKILQERLSAIICPRNDHVWVDGVCVKCGRMHEP